MNRRGLGRGLDALLGEAATATTPGETLLEIPVDQIDLEFANSEYGLLDEFAENPFTKYIGLGVVDVHSHEIEPVEAIAEGIRRTLKFIPPERMFVDPDCGLKTRTEDEAKTKLTNIKQAVDIVRSEL